MSQPMSTSSASASAASTHPENNKKADVTERIGIIVTCADRWQVYHRLQALNISCSCGGFQPLKVDVQTPTELLQLRSVIQCANYSRQTLAVQLNRCWKL